VTEFEIIQEYFSRRGVKRPDVVLGVGDDGAVVSVPADCDLVTVVDTLVAGVHFPLETRPEDIGYKALAVNLSDMAAMGADASWTTLALTLPQPDTAWLEGFAQGLFEAAEFHGVQLIGGDTTRGPLTVTIQVQGLIPKGQAVRRDGARPGDLICVTGSLGDAGMALLAWQRQLPLLAPHGDYLRGRLNRPTPRCAEGVALRGVATSMIDVSDGLVADLNHVLVASGVGASVDVDELPLSAAFIAVAAAWKEALSEQERLRVALTAGDDYELCFTVPATRAGQLDELSTKLNGGFKLIGVVEALPGLRLRRADGSTLSLPRDGYQHFMTSDAG